MKKRILSLTLTLCMLLGLLPIPALAAEPAARGVSVTPTITLGEPKSYQGENKNEMNSKEMTSGAGNYSVSLEGSTIHVRETSKGATASYVLQPFTFSVTVPAYTSYVLAYKVSGVIERGSKGSTGWFAELEDMPSETFNATFNTKGNDGNTSMLSIIRAYGNSKTYRYSWGDYIYFTFENGTAAEKVCEKTCAWLVGIDKPGSVSYLHQMDVTINFAIDHGQSYAAKTFVYKDTDGRTMKTRISADSPVTVEGTMAVPGHEFLGWTAEADGQTYEVGDKYYGEKGTVFTAQWKVTPYTLTYDYQGGSGSPASKQLEYGKPYGDLPTPTREGFDFICWGTTPAGGYVVESDSTVTRTDDHTIYAIWQSKSVKILCDANGGSPSYNWETNTFSDAAMAVLPDPSRENYTFDGWYTAATGGTKITESIAPSTVNGHIYAHWKGNPVTVTLNANGGSGAPGSITVNYDGTYTGLPTPTKSGYQFDGWFTAQSGGSQITASSKVTRLENHTLYARWIKPSWIVTFNTNGGTQNIIKKVEKGTALGELPVPAKTGHTFDGWYNGSSKATASTVPSANITYTAKWTANQYTVTLDANGGTGSTTKQVTFGQSYGLTNLSRTGYTFDGWYTARTGGDNVANNAAMTTANHHTLYAHWTANTYTVTFNANGGSGGGTTTCTYGQPYVLPIAPTKSGYNFQGWYTAASGGSQISSGTICELTANRTLYAHWAQAHDHKRYPGDTSVIKFDKELTQASFDAARNNQGTETGNLTFDGTNYSLYAGGASKGYVLNGDINLGGAQIKIDVNTHICLNGHTITSSSADYVFAAASSGVWGSPSSICDCTGSGKVKNTVGGCVSVEDGLAQPSGKYSFSVSLYSGTFISQGNDCVRVANSGGFIVDGATLESKGSGTYALRVTNGSATVNSGTLKGNGGAYVENGKTLTVSGGSITGTAGNGIYNTNAGTLNVNGGTITGTSSAGIYNAGTATVSGGQVSGTTKGIYNYIGDGATGSLTVNGGTILGTSNSGYGIENKGPLNLGGSPTIDGPKGGICVDDPITVQSGLTGTFSVIPSDYDISNGASPVTVTSSESTSNFTSADSRYAIRSSGSGGVELYVFHKHLACGAAAGAACTHSGNAHEAVEFTATTGGTLNGGSYYLTGSATSITIPSGQTVSLCLNGKTASSITVNGTLNLCNCGSGGSAGTVTISNGGTLNQYGVTANVTQNGGTWNFYSGRLTTSGSTIAPGGDLYLLDTPDLNGGTISLSSGKVVHLGSGLKRPSTAYKINYTGTLTPDNPQVVLTEGWSGLSGASLGSYFTYTGGGKAKLEVSGGEVALRLYKVTAGGQTYYLNSNGTLPSLPPTPSRPEAGKLWDGWYTASSGGMKITANSTVLNDDATIYPHWNNCTHTSAEVTTVDATCTAAGSKKTVCKVDGCGYTREETIAALSHSYGTTWHKDELNHWHECTRCGIRKDSAAHAWGSGVESADGNTLTYTCVCGATRSETIPKYTVTYELDQYTTGSVPTQASTKKGGRFALHNGSGLSRAGYTFGGWLELDETGNATATTHGAGTTFTMPEHNVRFRVVWNQVDNYKPKPGDTVVLPDGTHIKNDGGKVTIDQDGDGTPETTVDPKGGDVTIQTGDPGQKPTVTLPAGSTVQSGDGPKVTIGDGGGGVDPTGVVDAPVGSTVEDDQGNKVEIKEGDGKIDPEGSVTFPEGTDGKVTVNGEEKPVIGGTEGVEITGDTPLPDTPTVVLPPDSSPLTLNEGGEPKVIQATVAPADTTVTGTSSDETVATVEVDDTGKITITPVGPGTATITVTPAGGDPVTIEVTVSAHIHEWAAEWEHSDTHHWHKCTAENCTITDGNYSGVPASGYGKHAYDGTADTECNQCGYVRTAQGYTINYEDETITIDPGYEVRTSTDGSGDPVSSGSQLDPGSTIYIRKTGDGTPDPSDWLEVKIPDRPAAPNVTAVNETVTGKNDGKIIGLTPEKSYQISKDGGAWTDATVTEDGTIANLGPGGYKVREKATDNSFAGADASVTIATGAAKTYTLNVTAPTFDAATVGYAQPAAKAITITSSGNSDATIYSVATDATLFTIGGSGSTVAVGGSITTWTIQPAAGLSAGTYTATITVTYDNSATATAEVSFSVGNTHTWTWEITTDPTMNTPGKAIHVCQGDEHHEKHEEPETEIPPLSNTAVWTEDSTQRVEPTETEDGSKTYTSEYGAVTVPLPKLGSLSPYPNPAPGEGYTIDYEKETITIQDGYEANTSGNGGGTPVTDGSALTPGSTIYIRKSGDDGSLPSGWVPAVIPDRPNPPSGIVPVGESAPGANDGKLAGVSPELEYSDDGGTTWKPCPGAEVAPLTPGSYQVRVKATDTAFAGKPVTVIVPARTHYNAVFDSRGGSTVNNQTVAVGGRAVKPADPSKRGCTFGGWYTEPGCVHRWRFDSPLTSDLILYAKWVENTYSISGTVTKGTDGTSVPEATVTLMQGNTTIATTTTDSQGGYSFSGVAPGDYNVVAEKDGKTMTILVSITNAHATEKNLTMPSENVNSVLEVKGEETPEVVVGNLEQEAEEKKQAGSTVTVTMTVESKDEDDSTLSTEIGAIKTEAGTASDTNKKIDFLEIKVEKKVETDGQAPTVTSITDTAKLLEIIIPFDPTGKQNVKVYRYHDSQVNEITETENSDQEKIVLSKDRITVYAKHFSTYSIVYTETAPTYTVTVQTDGNGTASAAPETAAQSTPITLTAIPNSGYRFKEWQVLSGGVAVIENTFTMPAGNVAVKAIFEPVSSGPSGGSPTGGGGGGSGAPTYPPVIEQPAHGTITVSPSRPESGDKVTITVTPENGYETQTVTVTDRNGRSVKVTKNANGTYTFTQPSGKVTISATLRAVQSGSGYDSCPRDETCPIWPYTDASVTAWYHNGVHYCIDNGLMTGYGGGLFGPDKNLSRAMLAQILYNQAGKPAVSGSSFEDVVETAWYAKAVTWAAARGIVSGYGDGRFGPDDNITREQLAVMLWRNSGSPAATNKELHFTDADQISGWALEALRWAVEQGLLSGKGGGILDPIGRATRAEAATMLQRYLENL